MTLEALKYPIGKLEIPKEIHLKNIENWINVIKSFPDRVKEEIINLSETEFNYKYRPEGWNIKQVVGHCVDSHMNSFIRFKLALTEENPVIRPYNETAWAELSDTTEIMVFDNLTLLNQIHKRWIFLLERLSPEDFDKTFIHPDGNETISLKENTAIYAWHCQHHLQHIINAKKFKY